MKQTNLILAGCQLIKLREYSKSYGRKEIIELPYIIDKVHSIELLNELGHTIRTMRKHTKVLIDYTGEPITNLQFTRRINKAKKDRDQIIANQKAIESISLAERERKAEIEGAKWREFLLTDISRIERYKHEVNTRPSNSSRSGNWRNWLRMKAAKHIGDGKFSNCTLSAPELHAILFSL